MPTDPLINAALFFAVAMAFVVAIAHAVVRAYRRRDRSTFNDPPF